jgi:hypothetical protein
MLLPAWLLDVVDVVRHRACNTCIRRDYNWSNSKAIAPFLLDLVTTLQENGTMSMAWSYANGKRLGLSVLSLDAYIWNLDVGTK